LAYTWSRSFLNFDELNGDEPFLPYRTGPIVLTSALPGRLNPVADYRKPELFIRGENNNPDIFLLLQGIPGSCLHGTE
jgi:hypothetical protein